MSEREKALLPISWHDADAKPDLDLIATHDCKDVKKIIPD